MSRASAPSSQRGSGPAAGATSSHCPTEPRPSLVVTSAAAAARCSACNAPLVDGPACPACGSPVVPATRRFVTVLFVDLVGYTRLCSELDVEVAYAMVRPVMNGLRAVCEGLGGVVPGIEG